MFKQPRVPEYRESEGVSKYLKALALFLKDFCQDAWMANGQTNKAVGSIRVPVISVCGKDGDVKLDPDDVGALPKDAAAADSAKLDGKTLEDIKQAVLLAVHPVGSLYLSMDDTAPTDLFGGEWEKIEECFLLAASENVPAGAAGGEWEHTHKLTNAAAAMGVAFQDNTIWNCVQSSTQQFDMTGYAGPYSSAGEMEGTVNNSIQLIGNTDSGHNVPPFMAVNVWRRIA